MKKIWSIFGKNLHGWRSLQVTEKTMCILYLEVRDVRWTLTKSLTHVSFVWWVAVKEEDVKPSLPCGRLYKVPVTIKKERESVCHLLLLEWTQSHWSGKEVICSCISWWSACWWEGLCCLSLLSRSLVSPLVCLLR